MYNFRRGLIGQLVGAGHEVHVIVPPDEFSSRLEHIGCRVHSIPIDSKGNNPFADLSTIRRFAAHYRRIKPDVVVNYTIKPVIYAGFAASRLSIPFISVITGLGSAFSGSPLLTRLVVTLYRWSQRRARTVFVLNAEDRDVVRGYRLVPPAVLRVMPGEGIDLEHFKPRQDSAANPATTPWGAVQTGAPRFLFAGRMLREKGVEDYVAAARRVKAIVPFARFGLLGPCDVANPSAIGREEVAAWEQEGLVEYFGRADDIRPYVEGASCVVLPSYYREGVPRILMEAAALARPVITSDAPGCRDVVAPDVSGWLVPSRDVPALAEACLKVAALTAAEIMTMGCAGRCKMVNLFDQRLIFALYAEALERAMA